MVSNYSVRIPKPILDSDNIEQLAQFSTPDGLLAVFWLRDTKQAVIEFDDEWYIQGDDYIVDSIAEIVGVKGSVITATNLRAGNMFDPSSFAYADPVMSRSFTNCMWSDFTCDYMILCADLHYPTD